MVFSQTLFNLDDFKSETKTKFFQGARDKLLNEIDNKSFGFLKDLFQIDVRDVYKLKKKLEKFDNVLFYSDEKGHHFGEPNLKGAVVTAIVLDHNRERKVLVYKKKRRKGYERKNGHRQWYSKIKIESIKLSNLKKSVSKTKNSKTDNKRKKS